MVPHQRQRSLLGSYLSALLRVEVVIPETLQATTLDPTKTPVEDFVVRMPQVVHGDLYTPIPMVAPCKGASLVPLTALYLNQRLAMGTADLSAFEFPTYFYDNGQSMRLRFSITDTQVALGLAVYLPVETFITNSLALLERRA